MDEQVKREIERLCQEQILWDAEERGILLQSNLIPDRDEVREHISIVTGNRDKVTDLILSVLGSDYAFIHPAWAISLYLGRN